MASDKGMNEGKIFEVVKSNVLRVLPDLDPDQVTPDKSLVELGANSIDRVEVCAYSMEDLSLKIPRTRLHGIKNLKELVDVLCHHVEQGSQSAG